MNTYHCTVIFDASSTVVVKAKTPEEAAQIAEEQAEGNQCLCFRCSDKLETGDSLGVHVYNNECTEQLLDTTYKPPQPNRKRVVFPTMLRKMWSGGEVQAWLDENVNKENNNGR